MVDESLISVRLIPRSVLVVGLLALSLFSAGSALAPTARANEQIDACGVSDAGGANNIFTAYETFGIVTIDSCGQGSGLYVGQDGINRVAPGGTSGWIATAPTGLSIVGAYMPNFQPYGVSGTGYVMQVYWTGAPPVQVVNGPTFSVPVGSMSSAQFGFDLQCTLSTGCPSFTPVAPRVKVYDIQLTVSEVWGPTLAFNSGSLWDEGSVGHPSGTRWVYGTWPLGFSGSSPAGIESMAASMSGETMSGPPAPSCTPNQTVWQQCLNGQNWTPTVTLSGGGGQTLHLSATSAALFRSKKLSL